MKQPGLGRAPTARIEELIQALEEVADPAARAPAQELLQLVLELHGAGLARLLELIAEAGQSERLVYSLSQDEKVRALLLLHGLYPETLEQRVRRAIDGQRLRVQSIRLELLGVEDDAVRLRFIASAKGSSAASVRRVVEEAILEVAPDAAGIEIEGLVEAAAPEPETAREVFIPVSAIRRRTGRASEGAASVE